MTDGGNGTKRRGKKKMKGPENKDKEKINGENTRNRK